jgi:hypothetical protein
MRRGWRGGTGDAGRDADDFVVLTTSPKLASVNHATPCLQVSRFNYGWLTGSRRYRLTGSVRRWSRAHA